MKLSNKNTSLAMTSALCVLTLALAVAGCGNTQTMVGAGGIAHGASASGGAAGLIRPAAAPLSSGQPTARGYILGAGDKLRIMIFNEQEMSREYEVDGAGQVTLALIGAVQATGKTPAELQTTISQQLAKGYIRDPRVSVEVVNYRPFYVIGEVQKAGEYPYKAGMNVIAAVAVAGGYTYRASTGTAYIRRARANASAEERIDPATGVLVYPGDIIRIPERLF